MTEDNQLIKIVKMEKDIEFIKKGMEDLGNKFDNFTGNLDKRYAPKWIQNFVWFLFTIVVAGCISIFLK